MFFIHDIWITIMSRSEAVINKIITGRILFIITKIVEPGGFCGKLLAPALLFN